jgi:hypothetical protein
MRYELLRVDELRKGKCIDCDAHIAVEVRRYRDLETKEIVSWQGRSTCDCTVADDPYYPQSK